MKKIIIFGFPHCGTSILKSIIGHIDDVEEIINETTEINVQTSNKYILCKYPFTYDIFFSEKYSDYIKIFIIRNPIYVFSSINKRFEYKIPDCHKIDKYINTIKKFIFHKDNPSKNMYTIRYEDLFDNNFQKLKYIFNSIGFNYTEQIFNNTEFNNQIITNVKLLENKPKNINHEEYRTWQINQPFISNNNLSSVILTEEQKKQLNNSAIIEVYPNINDELKNIIPTYTEIKSPNLCSSVILCKKVNTHIVRKHYKPAMFFSQIKLS